MFSKKQSNIPDGWARKKAEEMIKHEAVKPYEATLMVVLPSIVLWLTVAIVRLLF